MAKTLTKKMIGHSAHTQNADQIRGLPGKTDRKIKVLMLGAGSGFTPRLMNDILNIPGVTGGEIALVDIDKARLTLMDKVVKKLRDVQGAVVHGSQPQSGASLRITGPKSRRITVRDVANQVIRDDDVPVDAVALETP